MTEMSTQNFDDKVDVYYNTDNDLFYWIDDQLNLVKFSDVKMHMPMNSAWEVSSFLDYLANYNQFFIKV